MMSGSENFTSIGARNQIFPQFSVINRLLNNSEYIVRTWLAVAATATDAKPLNRFGPAEGVLAR